MICFEVEGQICSIKIELSVSDMNWVASPSMFVTPGKHEGSGKKPAQQVL